MIGTKKEAAPIRVLMLGAGLDVKGGISTVERLILAHAVPEVQITHVATFTSTFSGGTAVSNLSVFVRALGTLVRSAVTNSIDVFHIHFSVRGDTVRAWILALAALTLGKPFILHAHGGAYREYFASLPSVSRKMATEIFSRCARLIALSNEWRDFYLLIFRLRPEQLVVLRNPVELPPAIPVRRGREAVTFVFLGVIGRTSLAQDKGAFDLIRAFARLPTKDKPSARLILAGSGDLDGARNLIESLSLEKSVTVRSWVGPDERDQLLSKGDVFVLPSHYEGLPMSMLEAMAWGLPVIVTPVGGIPEIVADGIQGLFVQPGNVDQISRAMNELLTDEERRISCGASARRAVEDLRVSDYAHSLSRTYKSLLADLGGKSLAQR
jgi:glycosyltransferase involved in cell wall biosynthesis